MIILLVHYITLSVIDNGALFEAAVSLSHFMVNI